MSSTQIALPSERQTEENQSIGAMIQSLRPEIQRALPKGLDGDRVARLALTVVRQTPKLAKCTPQSFAGALLTASALGLEPGVNGEAYLVPYGRECQLIIGYQGYCKLFWQNPLARHVDAQAVYEHDHFDYAYGLHPRLEHTPAHGDRGKVIYYYAVASLSQGGSSFVVLTPDEVKRLRNGKVGTSGDVADPMRWMERKTALRQLLKTLPRSTMLNAAVATDESYGTSLASSKAADSITSGREVAEPVDDVVDAEVVDGADQ